VSINTSGKNVRVSAPCVLGLADGVLASLKLSIVFVVVVPYLSTCVIEAHAAGGYLDDNISVMGNSLVSLVSEQAHKVVGEDLVTKTRRTKAVELDRVAKFHIALNVKHSEGS